MWKRNSEEINKAGKVDGEIRKVAGENQNTMYIHLKLSKKKIY